MNFVQDSCFLSDDFLPFGQDCKCGFPCEISGDGWFLFCEVSAAGLVSEVSADGCLLFCEVSADE